MNTKIEDAQINALHRMWQRYGQVFMTADDIKAHADAKKDPNIWPIAVLFKYRKMAERPTKAEGFDSIEKVKFVREPLGSEYNKTALIFDYDDTLRHTEGDGRWPTHPDQVRLLPDRKKVVTNVAKDYDFLLGVSNQAPIAKGLPEKVAVACFERTNELLGQKIEYYYCPHNVPPITCYCRKPQSGIAVMLIEKHKLNPANCLFVGDAGSDRTFAGRIGFQFAEADKFF
jgi:HAD superfamily hydrolase (TIGR01662 family)